MLERLKGIERKTWVEVEGAGRVYAIADEDLNAERGEDRGGAFRPGRAPRGDARAFETGARSTIGVDHRITKARSSPPPSSAPR